MNPAPVPIPRAAADLPQDEAVAAVDEPADPARSAPSATSPAIPTVMPAIAKP